MTQGVRARPSPSSTAPTRWSAKRPTSRRPAPKSRLLRRRRPRLTGHSWRARTKVSKPRVTTSVRRVLKNETAETGSLRRRARGRRRRAASGPSAPSAASTSSSSARPTCPWRTTGPGTSPAGAARRARAACESLRHAFVAGELRVGSSRRAKWGAHFVALTTAGAWAMAPGKDGDDFGVAAALDAALETLGASRATRLAAKAASRVPGQPAGVAVLAACGPGGAERRAWAEFGETPKDRARVTLDAGARRRRGRRRGIRRRGIRDLPGRRMVPRAGSRRRGLGGRVDHQ